MPIHMELQTDQLTALYQISQYTDRSIYVNGNWYHEDVWVTPDALGRWDRTAGLSLAVLDATNPCLVLWGTPNPRPIQPKELAPCLARQIGLERLSIGAAARLFTALVADRRRPLVLFELE